MPGRLVPKWPTKNCDDLPFKHAGGSITPGYPAGRWIVRVPLGRDPVTGKNRYHTKHLHGTKGAALAYIEWLSALDAVPEDAIAQSELQQLENLERKAAEFRGKLVARVKAGALVEPGALSLERRSNAESIS